MLKQKLAWMTLTHPDACTVATIPSQVTNESFNAKNIKLVNKIVSRIARTRERGTRFHGLKASIIAIIAISGASFTNNPELSSPPGHVIIFADDTEYANILSNVS